MDTMPKESRHTGGLHAVIGWDRQTSTKIRPGEEGLREVSGRIPMLRGPQLRGVEKYFRFWNRATASECHHLMKYAHSIETTKCDAVLEHR